MSAHTRALAVLEAKSAEEAARTTAALLREAIEGVAAYVALAQGDAFVVSAVDGEPSRVPAMGSRLAKTREHEAPSVAPWGELHAVFVPLGSLGIAVGLSRTPIEPGAFELAASLGPPARIALEHVHALRRQEALVALQRALGSARLEDAFPSFATRLAEEVPFDVAWLGAISPARDEIAIVAVHPFEGDGPRTGAVLSLTDSPLAPVLRDRHARAAGPSFLAAAEAATIAPSAGSAAVLPLVAQDALVGVLVLLAKTEALSARSLGTSALWLLSTTAEPLSMALGNAALFARLRDTMQDWQTTFDVMDSLVSIVDEQGIIRRANRALARCLRTTAGALVGRPVSSLFVGQPMPTPVDEPHTEIVGPRGEPFRASAVALPGGGSVIVLHEHNPSQAPRSQSYSALRKITTGQNVLARGRVLIVDDEPSIVRAVARTLSRYHDVTTAADGDEALRILRGADPPFDAVITDIQMARVGGLELFRAIEKEIPGLAERVLFMTGGVFTGEIDQFLRSVKQRVLRKPFDPDLLRRAIDERVAMARVA